MPTRKTKKTRPKKRKRIMDAREMGRKGGKARMEGMTPDERRAMASKGGKEKARKAKAEKAERKKNLKNEQRE